MVSNTSCNIDVVHSLWITVWNTGISCKAQIRHPAREDNVAVHNENIEEVWQSTLSLLANDDQITSQQLAFIRLSRPLGVLDDTVLLAVPNGFTKDFLETRSRDSILSSLAHTTGTTLRFAVTVEPSVSPAPQANTNSAISSAAPAAAPPTSQPESADPASEEAPMAPSPQHTESPD